MVNLLLSGTTHVIAAPWLCGVPITALHKPNNDGFRPIAVGETFRRLASCICCNAVKPNLLSLLLPKGQIGVGICGGLEAAIHVTQKFLHKFSHTPDLCLLKVDFQNAFNECNRDTFLNSILDTFPHLYGWVHWSYTCAAELRFDGSI